jgi:hypothetical protein
MTLSTYNNPDISIKKYQLNRDRISKTNSLNKEKAMFLKPNNNNNNNNNYNKGEIRISNKINKMRMRNRAVFLQVYMFKMIVRINTNNLNS